VTEASFESFLERSLRLLEAEAPSAEATLRRRLGPSLLALFVDGESLVLSSVAGRLVARASTQSAPARLLTSRAALRELLSGRLTLLDAVLSDAVELTGSLDELLRLDDCLHLYLHGAVRCASFPALLREFLGTGREVSVS